MELNLKIENSKVWSLNCINPGSGALFTAVNGINGINGIGNGISETLQFDKRAELCSRLPVGAWSLARRCFLDLHDRNFME